MTIYATPPSPHLPVWDKNGLEWEPAEGDHYERYFGSTLRTIPWAELVSRHGPLSDVVIPPVGESFTATEGQYCAQDFPPGATFISPGAEVLQKNVNTFVAISVTKQFSTLPAGEWKRVF